MKGYVKIDKADALAAIIGFELELARGKEVLQKGIDLYYEKFYTNGSKWTKFWNKNKTPKQFARQRISSWGSWDDVLDKVLTKEENELVYWSCRTRDYSFDPIRALCKASTDGTMLIDNEMAAKINKYKDILESM